MGAVAVKDVVLDRGWDSSVLHLSGVRDDGCGVVRVKLYTH